VVRRVVRLQGLTFLKNAVTPPANIFMSKTYLCPLEVRGYELDSFGHVNHAIYVSYLEHARWKLLEEESIRLETFSKWKRWPVIGQIEVSYLKPTYLGDQLEIRTQIELEGKASFWARQEIFRGDKMVLKAKVRVVMVNETGRPAEMPAEFSQLWPASEN
jgi:acyl-CoA thioester hydrolase